MTTDLTQDPDYIGATVATHRATEGCSAAVAAELGMVGETAGRRIRSLGSIEEPERVAPAYKFLRFLQACVKHNSNPEQALAPLYFVMRRMGVGEAALGLARQELAQATPPRSFLGDMTCMHGEFGELLVEIDEALEDDQVSPAEVEQLMAAAREHMATVGVTVGRLEAACRKRERVR